MKNISRRDFIKGAAAFGIAGMAGMAGLSGTAKAEAADEMKWDMEADVVVVGTGTVITAAIAAADLGAESVIVLEKSPLLFGGTSMMSGGGYALPGFVDDFADENLGDTREKVLSYMQAVGENRMPSAPQEAFVDNANEYVQWIKGVMGWSKFAHTNRSHGDYYENYTGSIGYGRGSAFAFDADGNQIPAGILWQSYRDYVEKNDKIDLRMGHEVKSLITDEVGSVIGVVAEHEGETLNVRAKKGVVLGTGGFDYNEQMRKYYLPFPLYRSCSSVMNTGDAQRMGAKIGAQLAYMDRFMGVPFAYSEKEWNEDDDRNYSLMKSDGMAADWAAFATFPHSVIVNRKGRRFCNETREYDNFCRAFSAYDNGVMKFENIPAFFIADTQYVSRFLLPGYNTPFAEAGLPDYIQVFDTLEELADGMGIDKDGLLEQIAKYNEYVKNGADPDWHRGESQQAYDTMIYAAAGYCGLGGDTSDLVGPAATLGTVEVGPFYCVRYVPGTCGTRGGLLIDGDAQVLNVEGEKIPGLYAVGTCSSGVAGYWAGGACIAQGSVMSYVAVKAILGK